MVLYSVFVWNMVYEIGIIMNIYRVSKEAFGDLVRKLNFDILQILTEKQKISDDFWYLYIWISAFGLDLYLNSLDQ